MSDDLSRAMINEILLALNLQASAASRVSLHGDGRLPSHYPVSELAAASIAASASAISELAGLSQPAPTVSVSYRSASLWFGWSIKPQGWQMHAGWDEIAGDYKASDGWMKLHTNAPHHRRAALSVLDCKADRAAVADAVARWSGDALEDAIVDAGGCAARLHLSEKWADHPQGKAVAAEPLILWDRQTTQPASTWQPTPARPLAGIRVLDLTRVLAGPVATRFLAGFGADVLRIDPLGWDEPAVIPEVTLGKRCAMLDLKTPSGRDTFCGLLGKADILVHGYRSDALAALGLGADERQAICPGLIDISLNAYGHSGPWSARRGFDSLVQFSSGIAAPGIDFGNSDVPVPLPVQALDHATGYLMAAAAVRGLISKLTGSGPVRGRLSLARTAKFLVDHKGSPASGNFAPLVDDDFATTIEQTYWGPARRLIPPFDIDGNPMAWTLAASKLGKSSAKWCESE